MLKRKREISRSSKSGKNNSNQGSSSSLNLKKVSPNLNLSKKLKQEAGPMQKSQSSLIDMSDND